MKVFVSWQKTNNWLGIKALVTIPADFGSPSLDSYFNFYLGMNELAGINSNCRKIEAGISYTENSRKYTTQGWHAFLNNEGRQQNISINITPGSSFEMSLYLNKGYILLHSNNFGLGDTTPMKQGAPKMCLAIHEDHAKFSDRKAWFDSASLLATSVWNTKSGYKGVLQSGISFEYSQIDKKLMNSFSLVYCLGANMKKP